MGWCQCNLILMSLRQVNDSALCKQALRFILTNKGGRGRENSVISKSYESISFSHRVCNQCFTKISLPSSVFIFYEANIVCTE